MSFDLDSMLHSTGHAEIIFTMQKEYRPWEVNKTVL